jgi:hypothetical protein
METVSCVELAALLLHFLSSTNQMGVFLKRFFATALFATLLAPAAFAQDLNVEQANEVNTSGVQQNQQEMSVNVGDIIKKVIVGAIDAGVLDGAAGRAGYQRQVTCFAQNRRGQTFAAVGNRPNIVQQRAVNQCYASSQVCRPLGCQVARDIPQRDPRDGRGGQLPPRDGRGGQLPPRDGRGGQLPPRDGRGGQLPPRDGRGGQYPPRDGRGQVPRAPGCQDARDPRCQAPRQDPRGPRR